MSRKQNPTSFKEKLYLAILRRIAFFNDGKIFDFVVVDESITLKDIKPLNRKWISIIGRNQYFESVKDYPIGDLADLKKILANEPWRFPYSGARFTNIEPLSNQSHRVTDWIIKQDVVNSFERKPFWLVPESACLDNLDNDSPVLVDRLGQIVQVTRTSNGLVSGVTGLKSSVKSSQILGAVLNDNVNSERGEVLELEGSAAIEEILLGLIRTLRLSPSRFFTGINLDWLVRYPWKSALQVSLSIVVLYLALSSSILFLTNKWLDHQISSSGAQVESALSVRRGISSMQEQSAKISQTFTAVEPLWVVWDLFLDLEDMGVTYRAVNSSNSQVTFFLTANQASVVLDFLTQDARVAMAEYTMPVRKIQDQEQFTVRVTLAPVDILSSQALGHASHGGLSTESEPKAADYE